MKNKVKIQKRMMRIRDRTMKVWRKEKAFSIKKSGYNVYFGLSAQALDSDDAFEVKEDATKTDIKRACFKRLKGKKNNKKIIREMIEVVARERLIDN